MVDIFSRLKGLSTSGGSDSPSPDAVHITEEIVSEPNETLSNGSHGTSGSIPSPLPARPSSPPLGEGSPPPGGQPPGRHKPMYQRWWVWALLGLGAVTSSSALAGVNTLRRLYAELPDAAQAMTFMRDDTLTIRAADGTVLQQLGPATRQKLVLKQMPPQMVEAFVASEDKKFYEHGGVDYQAIARATLANISAGAVVEGGSTITQQLARIVFLDQDRSLERKIREALMAHKIEQSLTKDQILERYLNLVYLGSNAYGVADAAWHFFSKSVDQLTLSEMATIAGMPPAPSNYSPLVNLDLATQRRNVVLSRMLEAGYITPQEMAQARAETLTVKPSQPRNLISKVPYFTSYIQQELPKLIPAEEVERGGLIVDTTIDLEWQELAEKTIDSAIRRYGRGQRFSQAALVSLDPRTGEIKALVGGNDFSDSQFNRATQAMRQPGSTFKAFVYTGAIAAGFSPYKTYVDAKTTIDGYQPQNYGRTYSGNTTIREALTKSINVVAVRTLIDVGFQPVIDLAHRMGIKSKLIPAYSLALGTSEVNLLELTSAYGTLAAQGKHVEAHGITRVTNRQGKVIYQAKPSPKQAVDADSAAIMTWMLRGVVNGGTGANANLRDRPVAGKTGTSEQRRDLWFIGYIPQVATGIWLGNDNNRPTAGASSTAARVWRNFMVEVVDEIPAESFPKLPRLSRRKATIQAQRVRPRRLKVEMSSVGRSDADVRSGQDEDRPRRRRRRRSSEGLEQQVERREQSEVRRRSRRQREDGASSGPSSERAPQVENRKPRKTQLESAPAPAPASESAPAESSSP